MRITPKQLRQYIDTMRVEHLRLKHDIEDCEFKLEQNQCPSCHEHLTEELSMMLEIAEDAQDLPETLSSLEEYLAEDEAMNGWKGEDRFIEF